MWEKRNREGSVGWEKNKRELKKNVARLEECKSCDRSEGGLVVERR